MKHLAAGLILAAAATGCSRAGALPTAPSHMSKDAVPSTVPLVTTTIGFHALTHQGVLFRQVAEAGFKVVAGSGPWEEMAWHGAPAPAISFNRTVNESTTGGGITVTGAGPFLFSAVDLYSSATTIPYEIVGQRGGATIFTIRGALPKTSGQFATVSNQQTSDMIDRLTIRLKNPSASLGFVCCGSNFVGVDNIVLQR